MLNAKKINTHHNFFKRIFFIFDLKLKRYSIASLRKVSIKDIAEVAGVSVTLVSFVLNEKASEYRINEDTAKRIIDIANKLRYKPNLAAQSLREGRSHIIGIVLSDISNPFFSSLARLFEDISSNNDYTVFFGSSDERPEQMKKIVGNLINRGVDGLIVVPYENTKNFLTNLANHSVPIVLLDRYLADSDIKFIGLNNFDATYESTKRRGNISQAGCRWIGGAGLVERPPNSLC